jgi:hypothetical protein
MLQANTAPVAAVNEAAKVVFGADSVAVQSDSQSDEAAPQSASISTSSIQLSSIAL